MEVGRLAEAAGEEKSAKPPMRSEVPPGGMKTILQEDVEVCLNIKMIKICWWLPVAMLSLFVSITSRSASPLLDDCLAEV